MSKVWHKQIKQLVIGVACVFLLCGILVPLNAGCNRGVNANNNAPEADRIVYKYELYGQEMEELQQRYLSADEATKEEMYVELAYFLGRGDSAIKSGAAREHVIGILSGNAAAVTLAKSYSVSDKYGNVRDVSEEEALRIAAAINAECEADFQQQLAQLLGK
jgi:hypothetical protein